MSPSNVWQVMTPLRDRFGDDRYFRPLIVAMHRSDAVRIAEQAAGQLGVTFDGDIGVKHVGRAYAEAP